LGKKGFGSREKWCAFGLGAAACGGGPPGWAVRGCAALNGRRVRGVAVVLPSRRFGGSVKMMVELLCFLLSYLRFASEAGL